MLRGWRERFRNGGKGGGGGKDVKPFDGGRMNWRLIALVLFVGWLLSGVYIVNESERAVILRFGAIVRTVGPGIHVHAPWPIESRSVRNVTNLRTILIGCRDDAGDCDRDEPGESLMVTGDRNVVEIHFKVNYSISSLQDFLFNVEDPDGVVGPVAESAMREIIGQRQLSAIMTANRTSVGHDVARLMQQILDSYHSGIRIVQIQLLTVAPPPELIAAFNDVVQARQDAVSARNVATRYSNEAIPRAQGEAAQIVQNAEAYRSRVVLEATGEAARFEAVDAEYRHAPRVTRDRLYLETMQRVFAGANTVILDNRSGGITYIPLDALRRNASPAPQQQPQQPQPGGPR
jgi:membrane protease subunit HflK